VGSWLPVLQKVYGLWTINRSHVDPWGTCSSEYLSNLIRGYKSLLDSTTPNDATQDSEIPNGHRIQ